MPLTRRAWLSLAAAFPSLSGQNKWNVNYDESKVPAYTLPDPLRFEDGTPVRSARDWPRRRAEILALFERHVYGRIPGGRPAGMRFEVLTQPEAALGGAAVRKQVRVLFSGKSDGPKMDLLLYLPPNSRGKAPAFLGLHFASNHTVRNDPGILINPAWERFRKAAGKPLEAPAEQMRGSHASRWAVEKITGAGFALVTAYYCDIAPDRKDAFDEGVYPLFYRPGQTEPADDEWGAIGAWAWGLGRALDYLEQEPAVDARRVAVMGHSRLGKAALWASAIDPRFAIAISNNSGCMGAALSRRRFGETVEIISTAFPHWFCRNFRQYANREDALPVDQHELVALSAPRPVYAASAQEDLWADPRGEFLSLVHASPVWRLLGKRGLPATEMPPVHQPVTGDLGYHIRAGKHDVTDYDWEQYIAFAKRHFGMK